MRDCSPKCISSSSSAGIFKLWLCRTGDIILQFVDRRQKPFLFSTLRVNIEDEGCFNIQIYVTETNVTLVTTRSFRPLTKKAPPNHRRLDNGFLPITNLLVCQHPRTNRKHEAQSGYFSPCLKQPLTEALLMPPTLYFSPSKVLLLSVDAFIHGSALGVICNVFFPNADYGQIRFRKWLDKLSSICPASLVIWGWSACFLEVDASICYCPIT